MIKSTDTPGNDIQSNVYGNATVEQCKSTCNGLKECYGFVFNNENNVCYPKNNLMYPYGGGTNPNDKTDIYMRGSKPIVTPYGISEEINNIDTVQYENYNKFKGGENYYSLLNATQAQKNQVSSLQDKLNQQSRGITDWTNKFSSNSYSAQDQTEKNVEGLGDYLVDLKKNNKQIKILNKNMNNIVNDSDIVVLQKNYDYLFWSILAAGTVLITINIAKK